MRYRKDFKCTEDSHSLAAFHFEPLTCKQLWIRSASLDEKVVKHKKEKKKKDEKPIRPKKETHIKVNVF